MENIERLRQLVDYTCREIIDDDHPVSVAAGLACETPRPEAAMRVGLDTDASAMADEGVGHD
jgi:hypothetical protein